MTLHTDPFRRQFLPFVEKPGRYTGGELGLPALSARPELTAALAFPDLYELGMSYHGLKILYHLANGLKGIRCERVFMPWFDAVDRLKSLGLSLATLETNTPLRELDLLGVNLQYELHASNVLAILDLGGIPILAETRVETDPIILGGGHLAFHPEPFAPFFDAIALGDGEESFPEILTLLRDEKRKGRSRRKLVRTLGDIPGVYLPSYYRPRYSKTGLYKGLKRTDTALPEVISARITAELLPGHYPPNPIVPNLEATHNRLVVEIARGCSRGCRFCGPGMTRRPVRERPLVDLLPEVETGLAATGYSEVSLLSLSTADYRGLDSLLGALEPVLKAHRASLSFPSLRPDLFTPQMAAHAAAESRTGLTFAPEAAAPSLRSVINKETSDEALLVAVRLAFERGWKALKLYFMIGLPSETDEDISAMVELVHRVENVCKLYRGHHLNLSVSPFSPKPHTPFQWEPLLDLDKMRHRTSLLKAGLSRNRRVKLEIRRPEIARFETAIARSDRRGAQAILNAYEDGALFDAWSDGFSARRWERAFQRAGLELDRITGKLDPDTILPWDHLDAGISREFLSGERKAAASGMFTRDCRVAGCNLCGLQERAELPCPEVLEPAVQLPPEVEFPQPPETFHRYRLTYRRDERARFNAHLDVLGILSRALQRLGVPLEFTQGFKPHLRLASSPPLALGLLSVAEYLEFGIGREWSSELHRRLQGALPAGFEVVGVKDLPSDQPSIGALNVFLYRAAPFDSLDRSRRDRRIAALLASEQLPLLRYKKGKSRVLDAKASLWRLERSGDSIYVGLKATDGPTARVTEIVGLVAADQDEDQPLSSAQVIADWAIERMGMWWEIAGERVSPSEQDVVTKIENKTL